MQRIRSSTAGQVVVVGPFLDDTDFKTPETALTPTVTLVKHGSTSSVARNDGTAIAHISGGYYAVTLNATDSNTMGRLRLLGSATGALPLYEDLEVLPTQVFDSMLVGTATLLTQISSNIKKNQALSNFRFLMKDSSGVPQTGKTVTVTRGIDNGAHAAGTLSAVTEIGNGEYRVDFGAGDLNGNVISFRATASGCADTWLTIITQP